MSEIFTPGDRVTIRTGKLAWTVVADNGSTVVIETRSNLGKAITREEAKSELRKVIETVAQRTTRYDSIKGLGGSLR